MLHNCHLASASAGSAPYTSAICCCPSITHLALQGANLSDSLMDRAVIVGANLKNANLTRAVFTRWGATCLGTISLPVSYSTSVRHALPSVVLLLSDTAVWHCCLTLLSGTAV